MRNPEQSLVDTAVSWADDVNLAEHLLYRQLREGHADRTAALYEDTNLTYGQVAGLTLKTAALLLRRRVDPGDRVLLLMPDSPAFIAVFFALLHTGAIAVPINPALLAADVAHIAAHVGARLAFIDGSLMSKFAYLGEAGLSIVSTGDCHLRSAMLEKELTTIGETWGPVHRANDAIAYCLYSSGTTGAPKGIPHRHIDILHCIRAYSLPVLQMSPHDRVLAVPKLTFGYGLGGNLLSSFFVGGTVILLREPASGVSIAKAAQLYRPTLFLAQPRMIAELLACERRDMFDRLRLAVTAGEALSPRLYQRWQDVFGVELLDGFGSTEIGHVFISNHAGDVRRGSAGRVVGGFEVKILDDSGAPAAANTIGHLWARGPSLTRGYWNDNERTQQSFVDGWVRTGDLFRRDEAGYLYSCGRADEMIKAGCGQWVSPTEIEALLDEDDALVECAVVGHADADGVVRPKAYVVLRPGERPSLEIERRLRRMVVERWPDLDHKHLGAVEFTTTLPRTSTGKLQRFKLRPTTLTDFSYDC